MDRILLFGTESDLDNLVKYKDWARGGTCKCISSDMYGQLYRLHILIRNTSVPRLFYFQGHMKRLTERFFSFYIIKNLH